MAQAPHHAARPKPLLYSDYINDRALVQALRLPACPEGVAPAQWPAEPPGWQPGDDWPTHEPWNHDEVLFIRVHQGFEVWFALIIHELRSVLTEAKALWSRHGRDLPRVDLGARLDEDGPPLDHRRFPQLAAAIAQVIAREPAAEKPLGQLSGPGRLACDAGLPRTVLDDPALAHALAQTLERWTDRLERARQALLVTLPFFDVLSTLTPAQFLAFRDRLQPASGFGSGQFRELEYTLGLRELNEPKLRPPGGSPDPLPGQPPLPPGLWRATEQTPAHLRLQCFHFALPAWGAARVAARAADASLRDLVYALLSAAFEWSNAPGAPPAAALPLPDLAAARLDRFVARTVVATVTDASRGIAPGALDAAARDRLSEALRSIDRAMAHRETIVAALFEMDRRASPLAGFLHTALAFDAAFLRWRDYHIRFVEGQIGMRRGTGGGGIAYLRTTTAAEKAPHLTHAFPCLWQARSFVQKPE